MKVGAENRKELIAAVALMAIAALLLLRLVFSSSSSAATPTASVSPVSPVPQPTDRRVTNTSRRRTTTPKQRPLFNSLDPRLRLDLLKSSEDTAYAGNGRNIFRAQAEDIPQPITTAKLQEQARAQIPTGPPPPPPINLKFYGFANKPGEPKRIFLTKGDDVFIAREGEIVDHRYKVVRININSVEIEDVLSNNRQSIPLTPG